MSTHTPTPKMKTTIKRQGSLAVVRVESDQYGIATTTMNPPVSAGDIRVENLKRQLAHLPKIKEVSDDVA